ncbi:MAG: hypothetical protein HYV97_18610 [Bdellovibrio sp.]|nr:hypothetical protein [Bdellovibrio sp.]
MLWSRPHKRIFSLALLLVSGSLLAQDLSLVEEALMDQGDTYFQNGYYELAATYYQRLLANTRDPFIQTMIQKKLEDIKALTAEGTVSPHQFSFGQHIFYDSNVLKSGPDSQVSSSEMASPGTTTNLRQGYFKNLAEFTALQHGLTASYTRYTERNRPTIYQNDSLQLGLSESIIWQHSFLKQKSQARYELYADYSYEDHDAAKQLKYFSKDYGLNVTEMLELSKQHQFYLGIKYQHYQNYQEGSKLDIYTPSMAYSYTSKKGTQWYHALEMQNQLAQDPYNDTRIYQYQLQVTFPGKRWRVSPYFVLQIQDSMAQQEIRGWEKVLNPGVSMDYSLSKRWAMNSNIFYRKRTSKERSSYSYDEYVIQSGVSYAY